MELARRKAVIEPGLISAQGYMGRVQYLLPIYLTKMNKPVCNDTDSYGRILFRKHLSDP